MGAMSALGRTEKGLPPDSAALHEDIERAARRLANGELANGCYPYAALTRRGRERITALAYRLAELEHDSNSGKMRMAPLDLENAKQAEKRRSGLPEINERIRRKVEYRGLMRDAIRTIETELDGGITWGQLRKLMRAHGNPGRGHTPDTAVLDAVDRIVNPHLHRDGI